MAKHVMTPEEMAARRRYIDMMRSFHNTAAQVPVTQTLRWMRRQRRLGRTVSGVPNAK